MKIDTKGALGTTTSIEQTSRPTIDGVLFGLACSDPEVAKSLPEALTRVFAQLELSVSQTEKGKAIVAALVDAVAGMSRTKAMVELEDRLRSLAAAPFKSRLGADSLHLEQADEQGTLARGVMISIREDGRCSIDGWEKTKGGFDCDNAKRAEVADALERILGATDANDPINAFAAKLRES